MGCLLWKEKITSRVETRAQRLELKVVETHFQTWSPRPGTFNIEGGRYDTVWFLRLDYPRHCHSYLAFFNTHFERSQKSCFLDPPDPDKLRPDPVAKLLMICWSADTVIHICVCCGFEPLVLGWFIVCVLLMKQMTSYGGVIDVRERNHRYKIDEV